MYKAEQTLKLKVFLYRAEQTPKVKVFLYRAEQTLKLKVFLYRAEQNLKLKVFFYRTEQTRRVPKVEAVRISNRYLRVVILSAPLNGRLYPQEIKLVLIVVRG